MNTDTGYNITNLQNITLSDRSQTWKATCYITWFNLYEMSRCKSRDRKTARGCGQGGMGAGGNWNWLLMGKGVVGDGMFRNWIVVMVVPIGAYTKNHWVASLKKKATTESPIQWKGRVGVDEKASASICCPDCHFKYDHKCSERKRTEKVTWWKQ